MLNLAAALVGIFNTLPLLIATCKQAKKEGVLGSGGYKEMSSILADQ
jgi:hypothetical protein